MINYRNTKDILNNKKKLSDLILISHKKQIKFVYYEHRIRALYKTPLSISYYNIIIFFACITCYYCITIVVITCINFITCKTEQIKNSI